MKTCNANFFSRFRQRKMFSKVEAVIRYDVRLKPGGKNKETKYIMVKVEFSFTLLQDHQISFKY